MTTTLLQPYMLLGAVYAGFVIGLWYSVLRLFIPAGLNISARITAGAIDLLFYIGATPVAAWALFSFSNGMPLPFMLITMGLAALICIKTTGKLLYIIKIRLIVMLKR